MNKTRLRQMTEIPEAWIVAGAQAIIDAEVLGPAESFAYAEPIRAATRAVLEAVLPLVRGRWEREEYHAWERAHEAPTVYSENPRGQVGEGAKADALIAIERARAQGLYDEEQIARLRPLISWLRAANMDAGD